MAGRGAVGQRGAGGPPVALLLSLVPALAPSAGLAQVSVSDLRGSSISAQYEFQEHSSLVEKDGSRSVAPAARYRYAQQIYVAPTGRIFRRFQFSDLNKGFERDFPRFDTISETRTERFEFVDGTGFVFRKLAGDDRQPSTYLEVFTIRLARSGDGFTCDAQRTVLLLKGASEYVSHIDPALPWRTKTVYSQRQTGQSCRVFRGNVFAGAAEPAQP
jgi:hypothetical protein